MNPGEPTGQHHTYVRIRYTSYVYTFSTYTYRRAVEGDFSVMAKAKGTISIDPNTWEQAKRTYDNTSERIEELLKADLDVTEIEDEEMLKDKIQELEEERDSIKDEMESLQGQLDGVESELNAAKATLEKARREREEKSGELDRFTSLLPEKVEDRDWTQASDIPDYWSNELDKSKEELWELREE